MTWPLQADGTIDWKLVFEDPETGLIPLIDRASTPEKLVSCVHVVVHSLFVRADDETLRRAYLSELDSLIRRHKELSFDAEMGLSLLKGNIQALLRSIKNDRIASAQATAEAQPADSDRRKADQAQDRLQDWMNRKA